MKSLLISSFTLFSIYSFSQTFSNTSTAACNSWNSGDAYTGFTRNISVSGFSSPLSSSGTVLQQVNLQLGNASCKGNLKTYYARILSPSGTVIQLFGPFTASSTSQWINLKIRDDASLTQVIDYTTTVEYSYSPHSIGYWRTDAADAFSAVNGEDPNGNWVLQIKEATSSEVSFEKVELVFGSPILVNDVTGSSAYNECSGVVCMDGSQVVRSTNDGFSENDPNFPGTTVSGCGWNGANNNSAWFEFTASATTSYITVSGLKNSSTGSSDMQAIVLERSGADCSSGTWSVPVGGCLDDVGDVSSINLMPYHSSNGGGTSTINNLYSNGISTNIEFNLSGLTVGKKYYLYIDGNGGAASDFYIEITSGAQPCSVLPVTLTRFNGVKQNNYNELSWSTSTEINNDYFELERSYDGVRFERISTIDGAGNSNNLLYYSELDFEIDQSERINYYRLKQVDFNGQYRYSEVVALRNESDHNVSIYPNPGKTYLTLSGKSGELTSYQIYSIDGKMINQGIFNTTCKVDINGYSTGTYIIRTVSINKTEQQKFIKE